MRLGDPGLYKNNLCIFLVYVSLKDDSILERHKFIRYSLTLIGFPLAFFANYNFFESPFSFVPKLLSPDGGRDRRPVVLEKRTPSREPPFWSRRQLAGLAGSPSGARRPRGGEGLPEEKATAGQQKLTPPLWHTSNKHPRKNYIIALRAP